MATAPFIGPATAVIAPYRIAKIQSARICCRADCAARQCANRRAGSGITGHCAYGGAARAAYQCTACKTIARIGAAASKQERYPNPGQEEFAAHGLISLSEMRTRPAGAGSGSPWSGTAPAGRHSPIPEPLSLSLFGAGFADAMAGRPTSTVYPECDGPDVGIQGGH
jgi:hypothetical protein